MRFRWSHLGPLLLVACAVPLNPFPALASAYGEIPPPLFLVVSTKGDTIQAQSVEPEPFDMVRVTNTSNEYYYLPATRIQRVLDDSGQDRTKEAVDQRRILGRPPKEATLAPGPSSRYGPRSITKSVGITEMGAWGRIGGPEERKRSFDFVFDLGRLYNAGARTGVGGSFFVGFGEGSAELGVRARFRYWLRGESSLDFSPGVILSHEEPGLPRGDGVGLVGQLAWNHSRWFSLGAEVYTVRRSTERYTWFGQTTTVDGGRDTGFMLGLKLGDKAGLLAAAVAAVAGIANGNGAEPVYTPGPSLP